MVGGDQCPGNARSGGKFQGEGKRQKENVKTAMRTGPKRGTRGDCHVRCYSRMHIMFSIIMLLSIVVFPCIKECEVVPSQWVTKDEATLASSLATTWPITSKCPHS